MLDFFRYHGPMAPGVRLFRQLDFKSKSAVISLALAVPAALLGWNFYATVQASRNATTREMAALEARTHTDEAMGLLQAQRMALLSGAVKRLDVTAARDALAAARHSPFEADVAPALKEVDAALDEAAKAGDNADESTIQGAIDATEKLGDAFADAGGLSSDSDIDADGLQTVIDADAPDSIEALSHALALGAQYQAKSAVPEPLALHQLFGLTYWSARHLKSIEAMLQRVKTAAPQRAARLDTKASMDAVWDFAVSANENWFGEKFQGEAPALRAKGDAALKALAAIRSQARTELQSALQERISRIDRTRYLVGSVLLASLLIAGYFFHAFFLVLSGGLGEVRRHLLAMTRGDLTTQPRPWGRDEAASLMQDLASMQDALKSIVSRVRESSASMVDASQEIASASQDLSKRSEHSAANLERSASSMEQMSRAVRETADNATEAAKTAGSNARVAEQGGRVINDVVATMQEIQTSSRQIGDIVGVIDGIAFQTNILALNAAVEAARAGEHGRGFAVVAAEVRTLAQRSAGAAREIKGLIARSVERVENGTIVVQSAGETMRALVTNATAIDGLLSRISHASTEQSGGIDDVSSAVQELDRMTQQNAALVEETAASAQDLRERAVALAGEVARFKLGGAA